MPSVQSERGSRTRCAQSAAAGAALPRAGGRPASPESGAGSGGAASRRELSESGGGTAAVWGTDLTADAGTPLTPTPVSTTHGGGRPRRRRWTAWGAGRQVLAPSISEHRVPSQRAPPSRRDEARRPPRGVLGGDPRDLPTLVAALLARRRLSLRSKSVRATSLS